MIITTFKNEEIVKRYKIGKSIFEEGFRILIDTPRYGKKNASCVEKDGETERIFRTRELAVEFVLNQVDKHMYIGAVDNYTMNYKE